jgi:hypothetical protein
MDVFISWSGPRSGAVANALRSWLPLIINALKPWLSSADIDKGARWGMDIAQRLQAAKAGIICLTPSNVHSDWILFEAGALSKTVPNTYVCPLLIDIEPSDIKGPLAQFQATRADKVDLLKLVKTLNQGLGESALEESQIQVAFEAFWPEIKTKLDKLPADEPSARPQRTDRDLLEEILDFARNQSRSWPMLTVDDHRALLAGRVDRYLGSSGMTAGWGSSQGRDRLEYNVNRKDGGGQFAVIVPTNTPLEAVEDVVKAQLPVQQPPTPPPPPPNVPSPK